MNNPSKLTRFTVGAIAALTLTTANQGLAQSGLIILPPESAIVPAQFLEDVGASERINLSGKLRMLSQRIPAAACNEHAGIAVEQSKAVLHGAREEFDTIIAALEFGNDDLNIIGEENRRKTLAAIAALHTAYDPLHGALDDIEITGGTDGEMLLVAENNMDVLDAAKLLVSELSGQYADPTALLQSDALTIDIAGRQRMLTQKMSKEVCLVMSDIYADASLEVLYGTINTFETALNALQFGMENAGISPAPTDEIEAGLARVQADWAEVSSLVKEVAAGGTIDNEARALVFTGLNTTMANMNAVVGLYSENSKLGL